MNDEGKPVEQKVWDELARLCDEAIASALEATEHFAWCRRRDCLVCRRLGIALPRTPDGAA